MSYTAIVAGLDAVWATVTELAVILDYMPRTLQTTPLLYSVLDSVNWEDAQTAATADDVPHYRIQHRLVLAWQDNEQCEIQLARLVDAIPAALRADPTLGGRLVDGHARIVSAEGGWIQTDAGTITHRIVDFYSVVWEV